MIMTRYFISILLITSVFFSYAQNVRYKLSMPKPQNHYYHVEMELSNFSSKEINVKMPIWSPGSYLAREFAKHVNLVKAFDGEGKVLIVKKTDKNTWNIKKGKSKKVVIK